MNPKLLTLLALTAFVPSAPPSAARVERPAPLPTPGVHPDFLIIDDPVRDTAQSGYVRVNDPYTTLGRLDLPRSNPFPSRPPTRYPSTPGEYAAIESADEKRRRKAARRLRESLRAAWSCRVL